MTRSFPALIWAEIKKEHRNNFHSNLIYFSLLIWPVVALTTAYYSYMPFNRGQSSPLAKFISFDQLALFLLTGYLGYIFFWCLVQSAWQMSFERPSGTMEIIFLSPVNRVVFMYGRALSALLGGVWLFFCFVVLAIMVVGGLHISGWWSFPLAFIVLLLSAVVWGGLLNVLFFFSRDSGFLYTILDEPMLVFSGVRIPTAAFPLWGKAISLCFPLTFTLQIVRKLLMKAARIQDVAWDLIDLGVVLLLLTLLTKLITRRAERYLKETGNMVLF